MNPDPNPYKRPASPVGELSMPPAKIPKTGANQLQINYLKREKKETIPLATAEEPLPRLLRLISEYDGVLQRHESLAGNLGACPVGPILLKRFERLFEGPPRILKSNSRDPNITWLDVVEFAQNKPEQFDLEKTRNGIRVCQFYLKQCRVEISEEDYVLIRSGMPQKLIPPQPILEDEEKELGVIDVLDKNLAKVIHSADQGMSTPIHELKLANNYLVSARARQLVHRLKTRRAAIIARRETDSEANKNVLRSSELPASPIVDPNGMQKPAASQSPPIGFTAVNLRHSISDTSGMNQPPSTLGREPGRNGNPDSATEDSRSEWMNRFLTASERAAGMTADTVRRQSVNQPLFSGGLDEGRRARDENMGTDAGSRRGDAARRQSESAATDRLKETSSVPIPNTPQSLMPQLKAPAIHRDDGGPFRAEMIARMENIGRGERVNPPCDRCRRLQMDCLKNLTACLGCTKKHAKCSWKDVTPDELESTAADVQHRLHKEVDMKIPSSSDWDSMLKHNKNVTETERSKPTSPRNKAIDTIEVASSKGATPRITSPPTTNPRSATHSHGSPMLDVRPPPLEQQTREAGIDSQRPYPRYSPFSRPSTGKDDAPDEGDRLAAVAAQVYRSASQSTRPPES